MIEKLPELPDNVLGFTAKGTVTAEDYETVIMPAVEALYARQGKVRLLYHLGKEYSGLDTAAMRDDARIGLRHLTDWEKVAVVSDIAWLRAAVKVLGFMLSGDFRMFHDEGFAEAKRWISE
jgi:hypothetical protein